MAKKWFLLKMKGDFYDYDNDEDDENSHDSLT